LACHPRYEGPPPGCVVAPLRQAINPAIEDDPALGKTHVDAMLDKQVDGIIARQADRQLSPDRPRWPAGARRLRCHDGNT